MGYSLIRIDLLKTGNYKAKEIGSAMSTNKNYSETEVGQIIENLKQNNPLEDDLSRDDFVFLSFWRATSETFGKHYPFELYAPRGSYTFVCTADGGTLVGNENDIFESGEIVRWRGEEESAFVDIVVKNGETTIGYAVVKFTKRNERYDAKVVVSKIFDNPIPMEEVINMIKNAKES